MSNPESAAPPVDGAQPQGHGRACPKVPHVGDGYLHGADDDGPYDVDGVQYCGRCHGWMFLTPATAVDGDPRASHAATEQQRPTINAGPCIQDLVVTDIQARKAVGLERYGTILQPNNGRDALLDAYQEALDLAVYLKQALVEAALAAPPPATPLPPEQSCVCSVPDFVGYQGESETWRCLVCGRHPSGTDRIQVRLLQRTTVAPHGQPPPDLPKRDAPALIEALRIRAMCLTGAQWERTATAAMMKEAADEIERLKGETTPAPSSPAEENPHENSSGVERRTTVESTEASRQSTRANGARDGYSGSDEARVRDVRSGMGHIGESGGAEQGSGQPAIAEASSLAPLRALADSWEVEKVHDGMDNGVKMRILGQRICASALKRILTALAGEP